MSRECFAYCRGCAVGFSLGVVIPCDLNVFIAGLKAAKCPECRTIDNVYFKWDEQTSPQQGMDDAEPSETKVRALYDGYQGRFLK